MTMSNAASTARGRPAGEAGTFPKPGRTQAWRAAPAMAITPDCMVAAATPERIRPITLLNTMTEAAGFHRPSMKEPFARLGVGELWLTSMSKPSSVS